MSSRKQVFLSYAGEDRDFAKDVTALLRQRGVSVFFDADLQPGEEWAGRVRREIQNASAVVLLTPSNDFRNRNNIWFEAGAAKALGKRVLAVLPPNRRAVDLPSSIADIVILDADKRPLASIVDTLIEAIPEVNEVSVSAH